jgi:hypothetical protein
MNAWDPRSVLWQQQRTIQAILYSDAFILPTNNFRLSFGIIANLSI